MRMKPRLRLGRYAALSPLKQYRYVLRRRWGRGGKVIVWIMLNPSTADASVDDPTILAITDFSQRWGYDELVVINLFAHRATEPAELKRVKNPVGVNNIGWLVDEIVPWKREDQRFVVAAWGVHGAYLQRDSFMKDYLKHINVPVHVLGLTKDGHPKHPLYIKRTTKPFLWKYRLSYESHVH